MTRLDMALEQIRLARAYTEYLLASTDRADWFRCPPAGVSHIGWQVGHMAMAEYVLLIERVRGARPEDEDMISREFIARFGRGSKAQPGAEKNPPADTIVATFDRVHQQALAELVNLSDGDLDKPPLRPHPQFGTTLGALTWAARHEMLHAGQIGLIRHQLGAAPLR